MYGRIIYNPTAGPRDAHRELQRVCDELRRQGWKIDVVPTKVSGDAERLARGAAEAGMDVVWVAGGDGTVCEVVNGLIHSETALGVLPIGTGNIWAKQLCIPTYTLAHPFRVREAALAQIRGSVRTVDAGRAGDRFFILWAGAGFDAVVTHEMEPRPRPVKRLGTLAYIVAAFTLARDYSGVRTWVTMDGRTVRGRVLLTLISNVQNYAAFFQVSDQARVDDGQLDVLLFKGLGFSYLLRHAAKIFRGRHLQDPKIIYRQVRTITIETETPVSVQADGDPLGNTPVTMSVVPRAVQVLVPPQAPSSLFSDSGA
jgi:YegS/Rv2252/BmrU family lipid kinase